MSFNKFSAMLIQSAARKLISLDVESSERLLQFEDRTIQLKIEDFGLAYFFSFKNGLLSVSEDNIANSNVSENMTTQNNLPESTASTNTEQLPSATIKGNLSAFLAAATNEHSSDSIFKGELHFSGEIGTANKFQGFVQSLDIDWQEPLAQMLGDPIGHTIGKGLKTLGGWLTETSRSARQDISEYLQEEAKATPPEAEQQVFFDEVDQVRSKTDRLTARVKKLNQDLTNCTPTQNQSSGVR